LSGEFSIYLLVPALLAPFVILQTMAADVPASATERNGAFLFQYFRFPLDVPSRKIE
jgi:hypothetical protein